MITVTLQGATVHDIQDQMRAFLVGALLNPKAIPQEKVDKILTEATQDLDHVGSTSDAPTPSGITSEKTEPEKEKKTRTRKAKEPQPETSEEKTVAVAAEKAEPEKQAADIPVVVAGKETVHQALQQVNVAVGLNKAREILAKFGINRISEIKPEQYKPFVDACNEAVMMHG